MLNDVRDIYRESGRFALAMPLLFLLPAVPELVQHAVEFRLGMYDGLAAFRAAAASEARMETGFVKVLALLLPGYWLPRYMAWGDARVASRPEAPALPLWLVVFAVGAAVQAVELFAPPLHQLAGVAGRGGTLLDAGAKLSLTVLSLYLTAWTVAAPLGNAAIGPLRSLAVMAGSFWRTVGYLVAGALPLMVAHYALGVGGIGRPAALTAAMLAVDGIVVALLAHTLAGASFVAARAAAARQGEPLAGVAAAARPATQA